MEQTQKILQKIYKCCTDTKIYISREGENRMDMESRVRGLEFMVLFLVRRELGDNEFESFMKEFLEARGG